MDRVIATDGSAQGGEDRAELTGRAEQRVTGAWSMPDQLAELERPVNGTALPPAETMAARVEEALAGVGQLMPEQSFAPGWGGRHVTASLDVDGRGGRGLSPERIAPRLADAGHPEPPPDMGPAVAQLIDQTTLQTLFGTHDDPIGEAGDSKGVRLVDQAGLDVLWARVTQSYGTPEVLQTPKGPREVVRTRTGGFVQWRGYSGSGGDTLDVNAKGVNPRPIVKKVHLRKD